MIVCNLNHVIFVGVLALGAKLVFEIFECLLIVWWYASRSCLVIYEVIPLRPVADRRVEGVAVGHTSTSSFSSNLIKTFEVSSSSFLSSLPYHLRKSRISSCMSFRPPWRGKSTSRESPSENRKLIE